MSREKQIEEMASILSSNCGECSKCEHFHKEVNGVDSCYFKYAEMIYNAGYRKQSEGEWVEKDDGFGGVYYDCTACGCSWTTIDGTPMENNMNYCPECGAKMTRSAENAPDINVGNKSEWISVEERLPEITETVLIAYKEKWEWETEWTFDVDVGSLDITGREWNTYHDLYEGQELHITHWMPLPEPPKKGGRK